MNLTALTARTPSGLEAIFSVSQAARLYLYATVPARKISGQARRPFAIPPRDGAVFAVGVGSANVGFDATEADRISAWMDAADAAIAATPDAIRRRLESDRCDLCLDIQGGHEDAAADNERAWERGDESNAFRRFDDSAAVAKLAEFDRQHPEIIEAIRAEKAEAHRRFLAAD